MPKKERAPAKGKQQTVTKKTKAEAKRREPPSVLYPVFILGIVATAALFLNWLEFLGRNATFWIFGLCGLALFIIIPVFVNFLALSHKRILPLVIIACSLTAAAFVVELHRVVDFGPVLFEGELSEANRELPLELGKGAYWVVFLADFREGKPGTQVVAPYTVKLIVGERDIKEYSDQFQIIHKKRKMARRARGYQEYQNLADRFKLVISTDEPHSLFASYIDPKLAKIDVRFYKLKPAPFWIGITLALLALIVAAELDALLKSGKYPGFFSFSLGAALGFVFYYGTEALPDSKVGTFAFDILVGGILGMVIGAGFFYALSPLLNKLNRKLKLLISR